jgi:hypothetical protein
MKFSHIKSVLIIFAFFYLVTCPWGLAYCQDLKLQETRVGPENAFTSFGYFNTSPESPDGKRLIYVIYNEPAIKGKVRGKLYICNRDLTSNRLVCDIPVRIDNHNAAFQQWIDNDTVAFSSPGSVRGAAYIVNADTGKIEHGPFKSAYVGPNSHNGKILLCVRYQPSNLGERGLYELDTKTGKTRLLFPITFFKKHYKQYKWKGDPDTSKWKIGHAKYSTDGSHIAFVIIPPGKGRKFHLFTSKPDTSDLIYFGPDKPMHYCWYDHNTLWGSDSEVNDGSLNNKYIKKWSRKKEMLEILAGPGCHLGTSPDRNYFAGETWYNSSPVQLFLYKNGNKNPVATIFNCVYSKMIWDLHAHVNPSFSRDGKRVYYNRAVSEKLKQAYFCDISKIVEND